MQNITQFYEYSTISTLDGFVTIPTEGYRNAVITLIGAGTSVMTVTILSSNSKTKPNFGSVAVVGNEYAPAQVVNLDTHTLINGSTGISLVANGVSRYELNENLNTFIGVKITALTTGNLTVKVELSNNI